MMSSLKFISFALIFSLLSLNTHAAPGDRQITFAGLLKDSTAKKISIKDLEQQFNLFSTEIYNPWDKKSARYTGILLHDLVAKLAQPDTTQIKLSAIDDYQIFIPKSLWLNERILLVTKENGAHIHISNKGPLRVVFPDYDVNKKEYEQNLTLWVWMINRIEFK